MQAEGRVKGGKLGTLLLGSVHCWRDGCWNTVWRKPKNEQTCKDLFHSYSVKKIFKWANRKEGLELDSHQRKKISDKVKKLYFKCQTILLATNLLAKREST